MKITEISTGALLEANIAGKVLKDPIKTKQLALAVAHDNTFPRNLVAALGPSPTPEQLVQVWSAAIDQALSNTSAGDLSKEGKFDAWLTKLYTNHMNSFEDITGEAGDALGQWKMLSQRRLLLPKDQDFNKFRDVKDLQTRMGRREYRDQIKRLQNAAEIEKQRREMKQIVLIDNERFHVSIPFNYGACYYFNNGAGHPANYCTGASSGGGDHGYFKRYSRDGIIIDVLDKANLSDKNGKWQLHADTDQIKNATQDINSDRTFATLFPGLGAEIIQALEANREAINGASQELMRGGYDINKEIRMLKSSFPMSMAAVTVVKPATEPEKQPDGDTADQNQYHVFTLGPNTGRQRMIASDDTLIRNDVQTPMVITAADEEGALAQARVWAQGSMYDPRSISVKLVTDTADQNDENQAPEWELYGTSVSYPPVRAWSRMEADEKFEELANDQDRTLDFNQVEARVSLPGGRLNRVSYNWFPDGTPEQIRNQPVKSYAIQQRRGLRKAVGTTIRANSPEMAKEKFNNQMIKRKLDPKDHYLAAIDRD